MPEARFRRRAHEAAYGPTCPDCGGPKALNASRCQCCWSENVLRADPRYWLARTCPDCGGEMSRQARRCRACANEMMRGRPRSVPVSVGDSHPWRKWRNTSARGSR